MSDDRRPSRRDRDDFSEFGSLFDDAQQTGNVEQIPVEPSQAATQPDHDIDPVHTTQIERIPEREQVSERGVGDTSEEAALSFGDSDTGSLPHWTDPPTGELPRFESPAADDAPLEDDVDPWSTFSSESPVWQNDQTVDDPTGEVAAEPTTVQPQQRRRVADPSDLATEEHARVGSGKVDRVSGRQPRTEAAPNRITIGTDPSGIPRRETSTRRSRGRPASPQRRPGTAVPPAGRDLPTAIGVGLLLAASFIVVLTVSQFKPWGVVGLVTIILALGSVEFYGKVSEKGYRPAAVLGIVACVGAPLAAYWMGDSALPLVIALSFIAIAVSFAGYQSVESGPLPNISITTLGVIWIGVLGSFAMLILRFSTANAVNYPTADNFGTDTLFLLALGVVANDIGALMIGSVAGRTPLRPWISPNKTVEGLIGGMTFTIIVLLGSKMVNESTTWVRWIDLFMLAVVIGVMAPAGDLVESMIKRNLDIKDFGSIVRGHGGILDRFDGFLFTLPAVYYLTEVLEPWTKLAT